jgi:hypothetical protein
MLAHDVDKAGGSRTRSLSGSSAILLNGPYGSHRGSVGFDGFSQGGEYSLGNTSPGTPATHAAPFNFLGGSSQNSRRPTMGATMDVADPYYRPPRPRKQTMDSITPVLSGRRSGSADITNAPYADNPDQAESGDAGEGPSSWSPKRSMTPAFLRMQRLQPKCQLGRRPQAGLLGTRIRLLLRPARTRSVSPAQSQAKNGPCRSHGTGVFCYGLVQELGRLWWEEEREGERV